MTSSDPIAATATTTMLASGGTTTANDKSNSSGSAATAACLDDASCASLNPEDLHSLQDEQRDNNSATNQPSDHHHKTNSGDRASSSAATRTKQWRGVLTPWDQQMRSVAASRKGGGRAAGGGRKIQLKTNSSSANHQPLKDPFAANSAAALDDKNSTTTSSPTSSPNAPKTTVHNDCSSSTSLSASCASLNPDDLHSLKDEQHDDDGNRNNNNKNEESEASIVLGGDDESSGDLEDEKETPEAPQWQGVLTPWDQQMRSVAASRKGGRKKQSALKDRLSAFENHKQTASSSTKMHASLSHLTSGSTTAGSSKVAPYHHHSKPAKQQQQQHPSSLQASCPNFNLVEDETTSSEDSDVVQGDNHQTEPPAVLQKGTRTSSSIKDRMRLFEKKHPPAANGQKIFNASYSKLNNSRKAIKQDAPCLQASCPDFNVRVALSTHLPKDNKDNSDNNSNRLHADDSDHHSHNSSCSSLQLSEVLAAHGEAPIVSEEHQKQQQQQAGQGMRGGIKTSSSSRLSAPKPLRNRLAVFEKPGGKPVRPKCLHESISYLSSYHTTTANSDDDSVASFQSSSSSFAAADALIAKVDEEEPEEEEVNFQIPSILEIKKATATAATTTVTEAADAPTLTSTEGATAAPSMTTTDHVEPRQQQQAVAPPLQSRSFHGTSGVNTGGKKKKQWHVLTPWQEQERAMLRTRARREGKRTTSNKGAAVGSLRNRLQAFENNNSANKERSLNDSWDGNLSISSLPVNLHR